MPLSLQIEYPQLLQLIKQLPPSDLQRLKQDITDLPIPMDEQEPNAFQRLLLSGPTMEPEQVQAYVELRDYMNAWTIAL
jgi:hypothetical protein